VLRAATTIDSPRTAAYPGATPRKEHTRPKPGPQSHGSSPPPRRRTSDGPKDPTIAELPKDALGDLCLSTAKSPRARRRHSPGAR
jgi:hypothetical protein